MQNKYLYLLFCLCACFQLNSQSLPSQLLIRGGLSVGSPIIVKNIPEGATGRPGLGPTISLQWRERLHPKFSLAVGVGYSEKGSQFTSPVSGKYDATRGIFGKQFPFPLRIKYTGEVTGQIQNQYLDFPITASFHTNKWRVGLGYQYAKLLKGSFKGSVDVKALLLTFKDQAFDESAFIKGTENVGLVSVGCQLSNRISLALDTTVSLGRLMTKVEEGVSNPRNVYMHLMVEFKIF